MGDFKGSDFRVNKIVYMYVEEVGGIFIHLFFGFDVEDKVRLFFLLQSVELKIMKALNLSPFRMTMFLLFYVPYRFVPVIWLNFFYSFIFMPPVLSKDDTLSSYGYC